MSSKKRRVVITGLGCVTPYGEGVEKLVEGITKSRFCFSKQNIITNVDNKKEVYPVGLVPDRDSFLERIPREISRFMSLHSAYAYHAAIEALSTSMFIDKSSNGYKVGLSLNSAVTSLNVTEEIFNLYYNKNPKSMPSGYAFSSLNSAPAFTVAQALGITGRCISASAACAGGLQAIALGYEAIRNGDMNIMVCGGTEEYHPFLNNIFIKLGLASKSKCTPFGSYRLGTIISEGAGIVVLETLESAEKRGADIYAEILGVGINRSDNLAHSDINSIEQCMRYALKDYLVTCYYDIQELFVNAHATGTLTGDEQEAKAIDRLPVDDIHTNALKGYLGHCMAASGPIELIASIMGLRNNIFYKPEDTHQLDLDITENIGVNKQNYGFVRVNNTKPKLLKNSFGFGGFNCSVLLDVY